MGRPEDGRADYITFRNVMGEIILKMASHVSVCEDFLQFQETLKKLRLMDDRIIHALNTTIPTDSFSSHVDAHKQCQHLYEQLCRGYTDRDRVIKSCIHQVSTSVNQLKVSCREMDEDDPKSLKMLRNEQTKLRLLQSEVNIEEVVKDRTLKVFHERCRNFFVPPPAEPL